MKNVFLADRHTLMADLIEEHINRSGYARVCARSNSLKACRNELKERYASAGSKPDLLLIDIADSNGKTIDFWTDRPKTQKLPEGNGLNFCREIWADCKKLKILACSGYTHWYTIRELRRMGIGHVSKYAPIETVMAGVRATLEQPLIKKPVIENLQEGDIFYCEKSRLALREADALTANNEIFKFTPREEQLIALLAEGYTDGKIADIMDRAVSTVDSIRKTLLQKVYDKFGNRNIQKEAIQMGLIWADLIP
jgi:DNA-binding NarL/FixJ family response regulator